MIRTTAKPKEHWEGRWQSGKKYSLYSVVENNGTLFVASTGKAKEEPYVVFNPATGEYSASEGWSLKKASKDSEIAANSSDKTVQVTDIKAMTKAQLDSLEVGDRVIKVTGKQKHLYFVTYKGEGAGEGICLSYNAAGYGETVSYDRSGSNWVYNSTDVKTYGD